MEAQRYSTAKPQQKNKPTTETRRHGENIRTSSPSFATLKWQAPTLRRGENLAMQGKTLRAKSGAMLSGLLPTRGSFYPDTHHVTRVWVEADGSSALNDLGRNKEDQFLGGGIDKAMFEQVAEDWNISQQWDLVDGHGVLGLYDSADYHGAAVGHQDVGGRLLGDERRIQLRLAHTAEIGNGVFHVHLKKNGVVGSNLRRHLQPQERVNILDGRRTA